MRYLICHLPLAQAMQNQSSQLTQEKAWRHLAHGLALCTTQIPLGQCIASLHYQRQVQQSIPHGWQVFPDCWRLPVQFFDDVGVPQVLWTDRAKEYQDCNTAFRMVCNKCWINLWMTEPGQKNQNHATEREIGESKKQWHCWMAQKNISEWLTVGLWHGPWDWVNESNRIWRSYRNNTWHQWVLQLWI